MSTRFVLKSVGIWLLVMSFGFAGWSQEKSNLPEFFGFYALDGGQSIAIYEGQGSENGKSAGIEWYSIPQNSKQQDTRPQLLTSARFVLFYSNSGEMIQSMSLYKLPYVRNIIETLPAGEPSPFSPPSRRVVDSPNMPLLAGIPDLSFKLLAKPVPNQPQMVELVPSPQLTPGTYVAQYSPSGANGWFAIFSVGATSETENRFCLDLILPGGPRGLFERANSELNSTVPLLASYRYTKCNFSGSSIGAPAAGNSPARTDTTETQPNGFPQKPGQLNFSVRHRHSVFFNLSTSNVVYYCYGTLSVSPNGTVAYDCERTDDPSGRCEHITFAPGSLKQAKIGFDGTLHIESKKQGKFDFEGNRADLTKALAAIAPHIQK